MYIPETMNISTKGKFNLMNVIFGEYQKTVLFQFQGALYGEPTGLYCDYSHLDMPGYNWTFSVLSH